MKKQFAVLALTGLLIALFSFGIGDELRAGAKRIWQWDTVATINSNNLATDTTRADIKLHWMRTCDPIKNLRFDRVVGAAYFGDFAGTDTALGNTDTIIMRIYAYNGFDSILVDSQLSTAPATFHVDIHKNSDTATNGELWGNLETAFLYDRWQVHVVHADSARAGLDTAAAESCYVDWNLWLRFEEEE